MEFCAGGDLAHFLRHVKRVPELTAQHLMRQLAAGLRQMWAHHLVHVSGELRHPGREAGRIGCRALYCTARSMQGGRKHTCAYFLDVPHPYSALLKHFTVLQRDLKPQNLLLSAAVPDATLKIADFGFARNLQPQVGCH
jgi:serine/threonine protein kinase